MNSKSLTVARVALVGMALSLMPASSSAGVIVSITVAPPILPVYVQPVCPEVGFLWTPGYWAYGDAGYFWVPGVWVRPPSVGVLWTPGYWGWNNGIYAWNAGYWGPHVGFYGGVNYGFGYGGVGFLGGRWEGGAFAYNSAVMNVGAGFHSYRENVPVNNVHIAFNGGAGGIRAQPNGEERRAMAEHHVGPTGEQNSHHEMASHDRANLASVNHGRPANAAMSRPRAAGGAAANHGAGAGANHNAGASRGPSAGANHNGAASRGPGAGANHNAGASRGPGAGASHGPSGNHPAAAANKGGGGGHPAPAAHAPSGGGGNKGGGGGAKPAGHPAAGKK